jgi:hypothetical protein
VQQSAVNGNERCQQSNAIARQGVLTQQVDADGMRMMNNALWIHERAVELKLNFERGGTLPLCRTQSVRSDAWRNQGM